MPFHNSYTRNCDHHILLIMTGNAHKSQRILPQIIGNTCEGKRIKAQQKLFVAAKWWLLSQLQK